MKITPLRIILCALALGLGHYYYTNVFRWRILEDPYADPTVEIKERDSAVLYPFRKRTVADIIHPTLGELHRIRQTLESIQRGEPEPDWNPDECLARLLEINDQAKLRHIPKRYSKAYDEVLWGIYHTSSAVHSLQECAESKEPEVKQAAYELCSWQLDVAEQELCKSRDDFRRAES